MAVTTTPRDILLDAYATSLRNQPGIIAEEETELLNVVNRKLKAIYTMSIGVDPTYFATSTSVAEAAGEWVEPEAAASIFYMEQDSDDAEVVVVLAEEQDADPTKLAVYAVGRTLYASATNPPSGNVTMYYTIEPANTADLDSTLDASWDEAHNELLVAEVALFLAVKDGRAEEYEGLINTRNLAMNRLLAKLSSHYQTVRTKYPMRREINVQAFVQPSDLLAG
jgi:hypothetical protein